MKRHIIILNPIAGKGHAIKHRQEIETFFSQHKLECEVVLTERPGHAITLAENYAGIPDTIVIAAGGDGTCNEVINGMMRAVKRADIPKPVFGVLAIGRGNDFAYGASVSAVLEEDLLRIKNGEARVMDVGEVKGGNYPDGRYFGNGVGIGFDAIVGFEAAHMNHVHGGFAYTLGALKTLIKYPAAPMLKISMDGQMHELSPALVSIMNGRRMGGSFFMAPDAEMDDGAFNVCMTRQGKRRQLLGAMLAYTKGTQSQREDTFTGKAAHLTIEALSGTLAVHADGETICEAGTYLEIINHRHALHIIG
ncbi:MAG: YegS/Rv2252/BmrU family lipid kinase [FCB group bacterium]|nr:YegS/Rv2252/BmrU family lipid kinase [FCB group bacterium]